MKSLKILNTREIKKIRQILEQDWGYSLKEDYVYLMNEKNRIFIINKSLSEINLDNLRIDRFGLYFAEYKNNSIRLSKEGAQLLVREAEKNKKEPNNIVELDEKEVKTYFKGEDLKKDLGKNNIAIILKHKNNILGSAKYKDGQILNFLPKIHRGEVIL